MTYRKPPELPQHLVREQPYTYDDYARLPDDGNRYELANGILQLMAPSPGKVHQELLLKLTESFLQHCQPNGKFYFAPLDVIFSKHHVRQPDFMYISNERLEVVTEKGVEGAPDLVAEILSPSTVYIDKTDKRNEYAYFGVQEYWIIDPVYRLLEQYVLAKERLELQQVYKHGDTVVSDRVSCVRLSINSLFG